METRICPECKRAFYSADFSTCPHCKYKLLLNGRGEERTLTMLDSEFSFGRKQRTATMVDYSRNGAKIVYQGTPLPIHTIIELKVGELKIQRPGRVVWTKKVKKIMSATGLRLSG